jgi:hypothetical protein
VRSGWQVRVAVLAAIGSTVLSACSDDAPATVTQEAYDAEAVRLCERRGEELLTIEELEARPLSDAARAAFLSGELVPAARAIVRSLDDFGYPEANAVQYGNAAVAAIEALDELQVDAIGLLDRRREGLIVASDDPFAQLAGAITAMDIPG